MATVIEALVVVFLLAVAAAQGVWLVTGWEVQIAGVSVEQPWAIAVLTVALLLAFGLGLARWRRRPQSLPGEAALGGSLAQHSPSNKLVVSQGKRYKVVLCLGFIEQQLARNEMIVDMFESSGFDDVKVTGSGGIRHVEVRWPGPDTISTMKSEIVSVREIADSPLEPAAGSAS